MNKKCRSYQILKSFICFCLVLLLAGLAFPLSASAFTLHVIDGQTNESMADTAFRWMVEVDNTFDTTPGDGWTVHHGDCVRVAHEKIADESAALGVQRVDPLPSRHVVVDLQALLFVGLPVLVVLVRAHPI